MHTPIFSRCSPAVFRSPAILPPATLSTAYGAFSSKTYFKHLFQDIYLEFKYSVVCYNLTVPLNRAGLDQPSPVLCPKTWATPLLQYFTLAPVRLFLFFLFPPPLSFEICRPYLSYNLYFLRVCFSYTNTLHNNTSLSLSYQSHPHWTILTSTYNRSQGQTRIIL